MVTNYDDIANLYGKGTVHPIKEYCEGFTLLKVLGDIKGKSALDLACGDGYYTRLLKQQGSAETVGVDISQKMLDRAKQSELAAPLGITYQSGDISKMGQIGQFDLITAVYLFPYAATRQILAGMFRAIYTNLKPGGRLAAITLNPHLAEADLAVFENYRVKFLAEAGLQDGTVVTATVALADGGSFQMRHFHWKQATYERVTAQAGFQQIHWRPIEVAAGGIEALGAAYWQAFAAKPYSMILECNKQEE